MRYTTTLVRGICACVDVRIFFICFTGTVPDIVNSEGTTCTVHTEGGNIRTCTGTHQTSTHENMMNDEISGLVGVRVVPGSWLVLRKR